jgi:hypothetical protein
MDGPVDPSRAPSVESRERLVALVRGYRISQAIYVATRLGIPDLLADERYPRLRGILFDQPHVIEDARQILDAAGVVDRCELVGGSFFDAVPAGGDAYLLRGIIPGFEDDQAVAILTNCRRAMATTLWPRRSRSPCDRASALFAGSRSA